MVRLISGGKTFTETEQAELNEMKANAEALLEKLSQVSAKMTGLTANVNAYDMNKVKSDDKEAINGLITRIDALLGGSNLTEAEQTEMTELKAAAQKLIKKIDDTAAAHIESIEKEREANNKAKKVEALDKAANSPATGDHGMIRMWFALALLSGGGVFGTTACSSKKRKMNK